MPKCKENMTASQLANIKGHEFKKGQSGNPAGRPKNRMLKLLKQICPKGKIKENTGLTICEIDYIEQTVLTLTLSELQLIAKEDKTPAYMKTLAVAIITDMKNGRTDTVGKLRSRQYGDIKQQVEVTGKDGAPLMQQNMTQEQAKELLKKIEGEF